MKKQYEKPTIVMRQILSKVTAQSVPSDVPASPPPP